MCCVAVVIIVMILLAGLGLIVMMEKDGLESQMEITEYGDESLVTGGGLPNPEELAEEVRLSSNAAAVERFIGVLENQPDTSKF